MHHKGARVVIPIIAMLGIVNYALLMAYAIISTEYRLGTAYLSDLARSPTSTIFIVANLVVLVSVMPVLFMLSSRIENEDNQRFLCTALSLSLLGIPFYISLTFIDVYSNSVIHNITTQIFYVMMGLSALFWVVALVKSSPRNTYRETWVHIEHYVALSLLVVVVVAHIINPQWDAKLQLIGIFGFLLILLYVSMKLLVSTSRPQTSQQ